MPANEMERIIQLAELDIDYVEIWKTLTGLARLASHIAGTELSQINLIDFSTQWTISNDDLPLRQMPREDSICQYTIMTDDFFEVRDLSEDDRFKDKYYVKDGSLPHYYLGVPLQTNEGFRIGTLCVMDKAGKIISTEKKELLRIIANEIVTRLTAAKVIRGLRNRIKEANVNQRKVAHDIRGPIGGIINLAQLISTQGEDNKMEDVLSYINLIQKSGSSVLELADKILAAEKQPAGMDSIGRFIGDDQVSSLVSLQEKLLQLYLPQAIRKRIRFDVRPDGQNNTIPLNSNQLLQIAGNLISNAIISTPEEGIVTVELGSHPVGKQNQVTISVISDNGTGMVPSPDGLVASGNTVYNGAVQDEERNNLKLSLVKYLVESLHGNMQVYTEPGKGSRIDIILLQHK